MRNSSVKHCHPGSAYLEVESVGAWKSLPWKQAQHWQRRSFHRAQLKNGTAEQKKALIDRSASADGSADDFPVPFSLVTCAAHFLPHIVWKKGVTNGHTAVQRQQIKAWREKHNLYSSFKVRSGWPKQIQSRWKVFFSSYLITRAVLLWGIWNTATQMTSAWKIPY